MNKLKLLGVIYIVTLIVFVLGLVFYGTYYDFMTAPRHTTVEQHYHPTEIKEITKENTIIYNITNQEIIEKEVHLKQEIMPDKVKDCIGIRVPGEKITYVCPDK